MGPVHDHEGMQLLLRHRVRELQGTDIREGRENSARLVLTSIVGMRLEGEEGVPYTLVNKRMHL